MSIIVATPLVQYENPNAVQSLNAKLEDHFRKFNGSGGQQGIELLLVVTPSPTSQIYAPVKRYCDSIAGVASQCVTEGNLSKIHISQGGAKQFALNVLMKINSKLGGVNVSLKQLPAPLQNGTVCDSIPYLTLGLLWC